MLGYAPVATVPISALPVAGPIVPIAGFMALAITAPGASLAVTGAGAMASASGSAAVLAPTGSAAGISIVANGSVKAAL